MDYDNDFVVYERTDRANLFRYQEIDKLELINAIPISRSEMYMALCKAGMLCIDFLREELIIYQPGSPPGKGDKMILKEKKRFFCPGLSDSRGKIIEILGYFEN